MLGDFAMRYVIHSKFHDDFTALSKRCERWRLARWLCRVSALVVPWIAYLGIVISVLGLSTLPFQIARASGIKPPSVAYWSFATVTILSIVYLLYRVGRMVLCRFRQRLIEVEAVAIFVGLCLATLLAAFILPTGWPRY